MNTCHPIGTDAISGGIYSNGGAKMRPTAKQIVILAVVLFLSTTILGFYSCSGSNGTSIDVVAPDGNFIRQAHESDWIEAGRGPLACYNVTIPASGGIAAVHQDRSADFHINVTEHITPPNCNDCILLGEFFPVYGGLAATITLKNPFPEGLSLNAYDVRLVILTPWEIAFPSGNTANGLINPDGFTGLYKSEKYLANINPYIHFGDFSNGYTIPAGESQTRELRLFAKEDFVEFTMIVDVSWKPATEIELGEPLGSGHCKEAHTIDSSLMGIFIPGNRGVLVTVNIYDWQNNAYDAQVIVEAPTLILGSQELQLAQPKNEIAPSFTGFIQSLDDYMPPDNPILIKVIDPATKPDGTHPTAYMLEWYHVD
jgi:hypothetical protein